METLSSTDISASINSKFVCGGEYPGLPSKLLLIDHSFWSPAAMNRQARNRISLPVVYPSCFTPPAQLNIASLAGFQQWDKMPIIQSSSTLDARLVANAVLEQLQDGFTRQSTTAIQELCLPNAYLRE
ncbi:hypothetical protein DL93DRAFT_1776555 [Clavulina sp. PMI_390]|nr:hypothetical protein DL93DRAFT_1776555 [Clavulina sp. PMI_390]